MSNRGSRAPGIQGVIKGLTAYHSLHRQSGNSGEVAAVDFARDMLDKGKQRVDSPINLPLKLVAAPIDWIQVLNFY